MDKPSTSILNLAAHLVRANHPEPSSDAATLLSDRLQISLTKFAGLDGYLSLLRRALALARADMPSLQRFRVGASGRLEVLRSHACEPDLHEDTGENEAVAITAHLLELLNLFIGEPLTLTLVREAMSELPPHASLDNSNLRIEND